MIATVWSAGQLIAASASNANRATVSTIVVANVPSAWTAVMASVMPTTSLSVSAVLTDSNCRTANVSVAPKDAGLALMERAQPVYTIFTRTWRLIGP